MYVTCWVKQPVHTINAECCRSNEVPTCVQIGYRELPDALMDEVEALLDKISKEAVGG